MERSIANDLYSRNVKQAPNLVYRVIDGKYYVTNPIRHEIVILNRPGFYLLQVADGCSIKHLCLRLFENGDLASEINQTHLVFSHKEVVDFLEHLSEVSLIYIS